MKAVILLNGDPYHGEIPTEDAYVICCDGAYRWAKGKARIDENLGDFDSLDEIPEPPPRMRYPSEKNETDGELALDRALELGADSVCFYGGGGGREDHFLGNLHLLFKARRAGAQAAMITDRTDFFLCAGENRFPAERGQTVSIIPFGGDAHILYSGGLKYPLENLRLAYGSTRGISNVAEGEEFSFFSEGTVLVVINKEGT